MKIVKQFFYYLLVAVAASVVTLSLTAKPGQWEKLDEIKALIDARFIEEVDDKAIEEAAAAAMIEALDDRWS